MADYYTQTLSKQAMGRPRDICQLNGMEIVDLWNTKGPAYGMNGTVYEEDMFKKNTLGVIAKHDPREPLFLFHSFHVIHTPLQVPAEQEAKFSFLKNRDRRLYAAMVNYMDTALGEFVEAFKRKSMWNNTLLILSSDNGGPIYGVPSLLVVQEGSANNIPLKGGKLSDWEGGIRVNVRGLFCTKSHQLKMAFHQGIRLRRLPAAFFARHATRWGKCFKLEFA